MAQTTLVLGGGGTLGAFQAGSLLALAEHGILPDRLVGCSAGALNSAYFAVDPTVARARSLAEFWLRPATRAVLSPTGWDRFRGLLGLVRGGQSFLDARPLRDLIAATVPTCDLGEFRVPLSVTTTCLECQEAVHHTSGNLGDILLASCALPGLLPPVRLGDGHLHVDGGIVCGVPVVAGVDQSGPDDTVYVLDCGFGPVTCSDDAECGLGGGRTYVPPVERIGRGPFEVTMQAFTASRTAANRASVVAPLRDPRVQVLPHISDAYRAGLLDAVPLGARDFSQGENLVAAGHAATSAWLLRRSQRTTSTTTITGPATQNTSVA